MARRVAVGTEGMAQAGGEGAPWGEAVGGESGGVGEGAGSKEGTDLYEWCTR